MTYLDDLRDRMAAALTPLGIRAAIDPATVVPPCLVLDYTPKPVRDTTCGEVFEWVATLRPPPTTQWLAAQWLAENRKAVVDAIDATGCQVTAEVGADIGSGDPDDFPPTPVYLLTIQA